MSENSSLITLVKTVLTQIGFLDVKFTVVDAIERDIAGGYEAEEKGNGAPPIYGGSISETFRYYESGKFQFRINKQLSEHHKYLTSCVIENDELSIDYMRSDNFWQNWTFSLAVPTSPYKGDCEKIHVDVEVDVSVCHPEEFRINAHAENLSDERIFDKCNLAYILSAKE